MGSVEGELIVHRACLEDLVSGSRGRRGSLEAAGAAEDDADFFSNALAPWEKDGFWAIRVSWSSRLEIMVKPASVTSEGKSCQEAVM